jgi:hypothetical protein
MRLRRRRPEPPVEDASRRRRPEPPVEDESSAVYRRWRPGTKPDEFTETRVPIPKGASVPVDVADDERVWLFAPGPDVLYVIRGHGPADALHAYQPPTRIYAPVRVAHCSGLAADVVVLRAPLRTVAHAVAQHP